MLISEITVKHKVNDQKKNQGDLLLKFPFRSSSHEDFSNIKNETSKLLFHKDDIAFSSMGYHGAREASMQKSFQLYQLSVFLKKEAEEQGLEYRRIRLQLEDKNMEIQGLKKIAED